MAIRKKNHKRKRIKYLATCKHTKIISIIIGKSPDSVIKSIFESAINALRGFLKSKEKNIGGTKKANNRLIEKCEPGNRKCGPQTNWGIDFGRH